MNSSLFGLTTSTLTVANDVYQLGNVVRLSKRSVKFEKFVSKDSEFREYVSKAASCAIAPATVCGTFTVLLSDVSGQAVLWITLLGAGLGAVFGLLAEAFEVVPKKVVYHVLFLADNSGRTTDLIWSYREYDVDEWVQSIQQAMEGSNSGVPADPTIYQNIRIINNNRNNTGSGVYNENSGSDSKSETSIFEAPPDWEPPQVEQ